jgi:plastocyanin
MKSFKVIVSAAFLAGGVAADVTATAFAAEPTIGEKGKVFSKEEITIKSGDTIVFINDDNVAHNVMSNEPNNKFNVGLVKPGGSTPVTFKSAGDVPVICAIHPSMKLLVKVTN